MVGTYSEAQGNTGSRQMREMDASSEESSTHCKKGAQRAAFGKGSIRKSR